MVSIDSDGIGSSGLHPLVKGSAAAEEVVQHQLGDFPQLQAAATVSPKGFRWNRLNPMASVAADCIRW
ncbi:MAG: hypothetical protein AAFP92_09130 [Bacteroidota bacterium]